MRRWRWDNDDVKVPVRWEVRSEREVQDILWLMLRSTFDGVIDEETLPKFGHSSYRCRLWPAPPRRVGGSKVRLQVRRLQEDRS